MQENNQTFWNRNVYGINADRTSFEAQGFWESFDYFITTPLSLNPGLALRGSFAATVSNCSYQIRLLAAALQIRRVEKVENVLWL